MGSPDPRYVGNQDYGRRLYIPDQSYGEQMGVGSRKSAFTQNTDVYQQSNLKKPYKEDDYDDMEYLADPYPGLPLFDFDFGSDVDSPLESPYPGESYVPWTVKFLCFSNPCYGYGEEHCEPLSCQWPVTGFQIHSKPAGCTTNFSPGQICAQCPEGETGWISFDIIMLATFQHNGATVKVEGRYFNMSMSHCIGLCDDTGIAYSATSDDTIVREGTAAIAITDSLGTKGSPYAWSVSGTGFTLDNPTTTGLTNTLNASSTACGTATVTVTGCGSTSVTGYVRCTTGKWVSKSSCDHRGGDCPNWNCLTTTIAGKGRHTVNWFLGQDEAYCAGNFLNCTDCTDPAAPGTYVELGPGTGPQCYAVQCHVLGVSYDEWEC